MAKISTKKRKIREKELQDAQGLSRKKWKFNISPKIFFILKLSLVVAIPIFYFIYSPLLVLLMIFYVALFFMAFMTEHQLNKSVIKSNHIHIPKFDSAIALILIVIAFCGVCSSGMNKTKTGLFDNSTSTEISTIVRNKDFDSLRSSNWWRTFTQSLTNLGTLLTGERSIFGSSKGNFNFGTMEPPTDFPSNSDEVPPTQTGRGDRKMSMDDVPVSYMFSSILSSVDTVLIFAVSISGALSCLYVFLRKRKLDNAMDEVIMDEAITLLDDEEINRILSFGEVVEQKSLTEKEINQKIQDEVIFDEQNETIKVIKDEENIEKKEDNSNEDEILILEEPKSLK